MSLPISSPIGSSLLSGIQPHLPSLASRTHVTSCHCNAFSCDVSSTFPSFAFYTETPFRSWAKHWFFWEGPWMWLNRSNNIIDFQNTKYFFMVALLTVAFSHLCVWFVYLPLDSKQIWKEKMYLCCSLLYPWCLCWWLECGRYPQKGVKWTLTFNSCLYLHWKCLGSLGSKKECLQKCFTGLAAEVM